MHKCFISFPFWPRNVSRCLGFAVCFTFVWHITFFAACVAIAGYAESKNLHSVICVKVDPVSKSGKYLLLLVISQLNVLLFYIFIHAYMQSLFLICNQKMGHCPRPIIDTIYFLEMAVFWFVVPCSLVEVYRRFRGAFCLHIWNVGKLPDYMEQQPWRQPSSYSLPWEP
jgi:hypothetical protein